MHGWTPPSGWEEAGDTGAQRVRRLTTPGLSGAVEVLRRDAAALRRAPGSVWLSLSSFPSDHSTADRSSEPATEGHIRHPARPEDPVPHHTHLPGPEADQFSTGADPDPGKLVGYS